MELVFDSFRTHSSADYLVVYAGDSQNAPLVGQFSGTSLPAPINSSSGKLFMKFISDASGNDYGFRARYHGIFPCLCGVGVVVVIFIVVFLVCHRALDSCFVKSEVTLKCVSC